MSARTTKLGSDKPCGCNSVPETRADLITLVSVCKPWRGRDADYQDAALTTWARLGMPVVLCGRDEGVDEVCRRFGFVHEPVVRTGRDLGLNSDAPLLSDVLEHGTRHSRGVTCFINADILVFPDFAERLAVLFAEHGPDAFVTARRRNFDFNIYNGSDERQLGRLLAAGTLHPTSGTDFFCFRPSLLPDGVPDLIIGRTAWDNWLMWMACTHARPPIDATESIVTLHPRHEYEALMTEAGQPGKPRPKTHWPEAPAVLHNRRLVGERIGDMSDPRWFRC